MAKLATRTLYLFYCSLTVIVTNIEWTLARNCYEGPAPVIINEDADIYLGVLLNVREMDETTGKCGGLHREAIELYEGLKWYLSLINQNSGQVASRIVKDSYIPGMKMGLKVYDACGDADLAERELGALFPELVDDEESECETGQQNAILGVVDFVGLTDDVEIREQLNAFNIPFMAFQLDDFLPAEEVAQGLLQFIRQMEWDRVSVLYADDAYSVEIAKFINRLAEDSGICFETFTSVTNTDEQLATNGSDMTAVLVVSPPEDARNMTMKLSSSSHNYQWFFSQPWTGTDTNLIQNLTTSSQVFAVTPSPIVVELFESYWNKRKTPTLPKISENFWLLEYLSGLKRCRIPELNDDGQIPVCHNLNVPETDLDKILRHTRVLPAVHVLNTFATSFKKAWDMKCSQVPGYCDHLREMTRKEFLENVHQRLELRHDGPGSRVPPGIMGVKTENNNRLSDIKLSLIHCQSERDGGQVHEIYSYERKSGIQTHMKTFHPTAVRCPRNGCLNCVSFREGRNKIPVYHTTTQNIRLTSDTTLTSTIEETKENPVQQLDDVDEEETSIKETVHNLTVINEYLWPADEVDSSESYEIGSVSQINDIIIPALFPVHKAGPTPLQCSAEINPDTIHDIEAFLWALDQVNRNAELLNGIEIGAVVFDTCSSPIKAAHLVSSVLAKEGDTMLEEIDLDPDRLLAVVSAAKSDETEAAATVLGPATITTISAKDRSDSRMRTAHQLQVQVPMSVAARSVIDLLNYYGWSYVTVIYSGDDVDSVTGFRHFERLAENNQICIGLVEMLNKTRMDHVLDKMFDNLGHRIDMGSRIVVLWTDDSDTQSILAKMHLLSPDIADKYKQLVWISGNGWVNGGKIKNMVKDIGKWITIQPGQKMVNDFLTHFQQLRPENNERNPWFGEYWEQIHDCYGTECETNENNRVPLSTTSMIQAVYITASSLARVIQDYCPDKQLGEGICSTNITALRQTLFNYLRFTGTDRPDDTEGEFGFNDDGYGDLPLEIKEVKGGFAEFTYQTLGTYYEDKLQLDSSDGFHIVSECSANKKEICVGCLAKQQNQILFKPTKDKFYLMGLFDVREKNHEGLWSCSLNVTQQGIQQTEAFLWALDYINDIPNLLPGIHLGAVGLDGCGTHERRTTEIARVFSTPTASIHSIGINESQILGMVVGTPSVDPKTLYDLHNRHHLPIVLSTPGVGTQLSNTPLLQLGPSVSVIAQALGDILHRFNWTYVSTICSNDIFPYNVICEEFQTIVSKNSVTFAADVAVNDNKRSANYWENIASLLLHKSNTGSRVIVALLSEEEMASMLNSLRRMHQTMKHETIFLITLSGDSILADFTDIFGGIMYLQSQRPSAEKFFSHFHQMNFTLNTGNPWLTRFWTQQFKCRGVACSQFTLKQMPTKYLEDEHVANIINGVLAMANGLEHVRQQLCPGTREGFCEAFTTKDLRQRLERSIMEHSFYDINGREMTFHHNGTSHNAAVEIIHLYKSQEKIYREMSGIYSLESGWNLTSSAMKVREMNTSLINLVHLTSACLNCQKTVFRAWQPSQYVQMNPTLQPGFSLVGFLPFHRQGLKPLSCGTMHSSKIFQNLVAIAFALDQARRNQSIPEALHIGATLFDSCGRVERAQQRLLSFLSDNHTQTWSSNIIGALTLDGETANAVTNVLSEENIPQLTVAIDGYRQYAVQDFNSHSMSRSKEKVWQSLTGNQILQTVPTAEDEVKALFEIVHQLHWKHVILFYDDTAAGSSDRDFFLQQAQSSDICVGAQIRVNQFGTGETIDLHSLLEAIAGDLPSLSVAVLLLNTPSQVQHVLSVLQDVGLAKRFIVVSNHAWGNDRDVLFEAATRQLAGVLTVSMETYPVPGYNQFLAALTLENHSTIPDDWFEEYYQHYFECHLLNSKVMQKMYPKQCSGTEKFDVKDIEQDPYVYHTVAAVDSFIRALHEFLQLYCNAGTRATQISDCGPNSLERFSTVLNDVVKRHTFQHDSTMGIRGLNVWNAHFYTEKQGHYERVGLWRESRLDLERGKMKFYIPYTAVPEVQCLQGPCLSVCSAQSLHTTRAPIHSRIPEIPANFNTAWGVVTIVFCILGLAAIVACMVYFARNIRKQSATSVLNYTILVGVAALYITSFFYLLHPSEISCGFRRFFIGISYTTIFAGLLVRSIYSWRRITRGETQTAVSSTSSASSTRSFELADATKPPGLLLSTLTLVAVQAIILSAWLIFKPPMAVQIPQGPWRCSPAEQFESELIISLVFPMILLFTAAVFSLSVWRSSDAPRDSRAMLACTLLISFTWIIWTLVATQSPYPFREPAIVVGNIVCAKIILMILYGRKVYDIAVHKQEARNLAVLSQFTAKSIQPSLQTFNTGRTTMTAIYTTDLDVELPEGMPSESYAASAEDAAMGLCLGLATGHLSRGNSRRSQGHREPVENESLHSGSYQSELFENQLVPSPIYPNERMSMRSKSRSLEGDRDMSEAEDCQAPRYRSQSLLQSRRSSMDLSTGVHPPFVRRIGSRQMLVLGDEASIHGRVSRI